ncbi:MAG TPA: hypothetical protein VGM29_03185 [Polyangiaceae bacterium]
MTRASAPSLMVLVALGCSRVTPPYYSGRVEARRAEPEALLEFAAQTAGFSSLGSVRASCSRHSGFRVLDGELLSDVDCSFRRLSWILRESAAAAGGEALVAARCTESVRGLECRASVARRELASGERSPLAAPLSRAPAQPAPSPSDVDRIDEPDATLATRIRLDFSPRVRDYAGPARASDSVREFATLPVWDVALGDLRARCQGACEESALRHAVLVAAGRLGAPDVVDVHCSVLRGKSQCIGGLAVPERDR